MSPPHHINITSHSVCVIPAKAGIQDLKTGLDSIRNNMDSRLRGNDTKPQRKTINNRKFILIIDHIFLNEKSLPIPSA